MCHQQHGEDTDSPMQCIVIPDHHNDGTIMGSTITEISQGAPGTMESLLLSMGECMGFLTPEVLDHVANLFVSQM
jgi:hypothetical protein